MAKPASSTEKLISGPEVAKMFDVSMATFFRKISNGPSKRSPLDLQKIPHRWVGGKHYYSLAGAKKLLESIK